MSFKAELVTVMCTIGCALGIGFVMQSGEVAELRYGSGEISTQSTMPIVGKHIAPVRVRDMTVGAKGELLDVRQIQLTSAEVKQENLFTGQTANSVAAANASENVEDLFDPDIALYPECDISALATPNNDALVSLMLSAPCYGGEPVVVSQGQMKISEALDPDGALELEMPALKAEAEISIAFQNGERITAFAITHSLQ